MSYQLTSFLILSISYLVAYFINKDSKLIRYRVNSKGELVDCREEVIKREFEILKEV